MRNTPSQDRLDTFEKALDNDILDWETFFHLDTDQRASAEQDLRKCNIISEDQKGNYEVLVGIRGITPPSRAPKYITSEVIVKSLRDFYESKNQQASIKQL